MASSSAGDLRQVPPLAVLHEWPRVSPFIQRALERGEGSYLESDVAMACMGGLWQLWLAERDGELVAVGITEIVNFPRRRKCLLRYLAGSLDAILPPLPEIEAWARKNGCDMMEGYGRKGWGRIMRGWTERYVILQKEVEHG